MNSYLDEMIGKSRPVVDLEELIKEVAANLGEDVDSDDEPEFWGYTGRIMVAVLWPNLSWTFFLCDNNTHELFCTVDQVGNPFDPLKILVCAEAVEEGWLDTEAGNSMEVCLAQIATEERVKRGHCRFCGQGRGDCNHVDVEPSQGSSVGI